MRTATVRAAMCAACIGLLCFGAGRVGANVIDLGAGTSVSGINNVGQVVGYGPSASGSTHAFIWQTLDSPPGGSGYQVTPTDLGSLGGASGTSIGYAVNDTGEACGQSSNSANQNVAFTWANGTMIARGGATTWAYGIDNSGDVVGRVVNSAAGTAYAIEWTAAGTVFRPLGDGSDGTISGANAINNLGDIGGFYIPPSGGAHKGFVYIASSASLAYPILTGDTSSIVRAINDAEMAVGESDNSSTGLASAFVWQAGVTTALPPLQLGRSCSAYGVDARGDVVGWADFVPSGTSTPVLHAVLWTRLASGGYMVTDLNAFVAASSGATLSVASGLNNEGQIVCGGAISGQEHGFVVEIDAVDVSMYTGPISPTGLEALAGESPGLQAVVVDAFGGSSTNPSAYQQLAAARYAGMQTAAFVYLNFTAPATDTGSLQVQKALKTCGTEAKYLNYVALDVEPGYMGSSTVTPADRVQLIQRA